MIYRLIYWLWQSPIYHAICQWQVQMYQPEEMAARLLRLGNIVITTRWYCYKVSVTLLKRRDNVVERA